MFAMSTIILNIFSAPKLSSKVIEKIEPTQKSSKMLFTIIYNNVYLWI